MSTSSIIAKQVGEDEYLTIFCHYNGYPDDNGATLVSDYDTPEKVDALLALGDLEYLRTPHEANAPKALGVVGGSRSKNDPVMMTYDELTDSPYPGIEYTYVFSQEGMWLYFPAGEEYEWRDLKEDLEHDSIHLAEPDEELLESLGLPDEDWDDDLEDDIGQKIYGGM